MTAYYNEIDPFAAQWLRNLIAAGHIAPGDVDERSIADVVPSDLAGYDQCHFFAGIGGWSLALRLAGWPDDRPAWTGSCPCQDFSAAGKGAGFAGERHLWPVWFPLIRECRPRVVFGEQVASPLALSWLDLVQANMEGADYAFAAFDLCAAGVGAPHIRQRLGFAADADDARSQGWGERGDGADQRPSRSGGVAGGLADAGCLFGEPDRLDLGEPARGAEGEGDQRQWLRPDTRDGGNVGNRPGPLHVDWRDADWLLCRDGKWRPVEPGTFPLAHGVPGRVGRLRAYGNAIVPALWAELIGAYLEISLR